MLQKRGVDVDASSLEVEAAVEEMQALRSRRPGSLRLQACRARLREAHPGAPWLCALLWLGLVPIAVCTWNSAFLFGTIAGGGMGRRRAKWRQVVALIEAYDVVCLQGAHGMYGDLATKAGAPFMVDAF